MIFTFIFLIGFILPISCQERWFRQNLDHFNFAEKRTWSQRYFLNDRSYKPGGPIFLMVGGEGAISEAYVQRFIMSQWAADHGALQVALEHRFYGKSNPLPSLSTENYAFLNSNQALADLATFIASVQAQYPNAGPVITFGGSYPGALASWFRLKYPHLTYASIASSAPVLAVLDMTTYLDVVDLSIDKLSGVECEKEIQEATDTLQHYLQSPEGRHILSQKFSTCFPLNSNWQDIATFMSDIIGNWMGTDQYNGENPRAYTIQDLCRIMTDTNSSESAFDRYVRVARLFLPNSKQFRGRPGRSNWNWNAKQGCLDFRYSSLVAQLRNTSFSSSGVGDRSWTWQTCQEFGYFQTTDSSRQPFGDLVPLDYYTFLCGDVFGKDNQVPRINETNILYGSVNPASSNVLFVNGDIDPWHSLGILNASGTSNQAILIDGTAHCADMRPYTPLDPPTLRIAQQQIAAILRGWLSSAKRN